MSTICAILPHVNSQERTLTCLNRLIQQSRRLDYIILVNNEAPDTPALQAVVELAEKSLSPGTLHIVQAEKDLGNVGSGARGMEYAFCTLEADYAWLLDDNTWPRPDTLERLEQSQVDEQIIKVCVCIDPSRNGELSRPLSLPGKKENTWLPITRKSDLPPGNIINCRGGWFGALYPRNAWLAAEPPTEQLYTQGADEYYWKMHKAGFRFCTILNAELELPSTPTPLIHYRLGNRSFFYEPGIPLTRQYYKTRNWAWLQRLRAPHNYPLRLALCGAYILLSLNAMLRCNELGIRRIYNLFRALHNGFYGKLRPY